MRSVMQPSRLDLEVLPQRCPLIVIINMVEPIPRFYPPPLVGEEQACPINPGMGLDEVGVDSSLASRLLLLEKLNCQQAASSPRNPGAMLWKNSSLASGSVLMRSTVTPTTLDSSVTDLVCFTAHDTVPLPVRTRTYKLPDPRCMGFDLCFYRNVTGFEGGISVLDILLLGQAWLK